MQANGQSFGGVMNADQGARPSQNSIVSQGARDATMVN